MKRVPGSVLTKKVPYQVIQTGKWPAVSPHGFLTLLFLHLNRYLKLEEVTLFQQQCDLCPETV